MPQPEGFQTAKDPVTGNGAACAAERPTRDLRPGNKLLLVFCCGLLFSVGFYMGRGRTPISPHHAAHHNGGASWPVPGRMASPSRETNHIISVDQGLVEVGSHLVYSRLERGRLPLMIGHSYMKLGV